MSIEAITWATNQPCPNPTCKLVLFILANYADEQHSCFPSEARLAAICGITDRSVRRSLHMLQDCGLLSIKTRAGTSNRYVLGVDASVRGRGGRQRPGRVDASVRGVRTPVSAYTKDTLNRQGDLNDIAG